MDLRPWQKHVKCCNSGIFKLKSLTVTTVFLQKTKNLKGNDSEDSLTSQSSSSTIPTTVSLHDTSSSGDDNEDGMNDQQIGDTDRDDAECNDDDIIPSSQSKAGSPSAHATNYYPLKASLLICKAILGCQPSRDDVVKTLKKKFNTKQDQLTQLTMSQLLEVMAKKFVNNKYCTINDGVKLSNLRKENIVVHKEISI
jgi:hypothetical protein